jgi:hypothetical protein
MRSVKRIISEQVEEDFVEVVIEHARNNNMTITNLKESMNKVVEFFENNAVLGMEGEV